MLDNTSKWSHPRGNTVVPSRWQATARLDWVEAPGICGTWAVETVIDGRLA